MMNKKTHEIYENKVPNNNENLQNVHHSPVIDNKQITNREQAEEVVLLEDSSTLIKLVIKTQGRKRSHTMVSNSSSSSKVIENRQKAASSVESQPHWSRILRKQAQITAKEGLQSLSLKNQSQNTTTKSTKVTSDIKNVRKPLDSQKQTKHENTNVNKRGNEVPVKQTPIQKKSKENVKATSSSKITSVGLSASSGESIYIYDRGVQCDGIFPGINDKFDIYNPIGTLAFLMKNLKATVKDEKANQILTDMEQVVQRISTESKKTTSVDLEAIALRTRLDAGTVQLKETSKKMSALCESLREERDSLKRQVYKQMKSSEEALQKQMELESMIKVLKEQLDNALKTIQSKEKTIIELQEENKKISTLQKLITELKTDLTKQTELARQRLLEMQYLMLERDKLLVLCSHKDSQLSEFRNVVKEFQDQITQDQIVKQFIGAVEEDSNVYGSVVRGGIACSSPSPTSSEHSCVSTSWHNLSDISLSTVEHNPRLDNVKQSVFKEKKLHSPLYEAERDMDKNKMKDSNELRSKDNAQLEFISLPAGESSHTILMGSYRDQGYKESNYLGSTRDKDDLPNFRSTASEDMQRFTNTDSKVTDTRILYESVENNDEKELHKKNSSSSRKHLEFEEKQQIAEKKVIESNSLTDLLNYDDSNRANRISVSIPSPLRHYPDPDWSDSSLPSISVTSDLNIVQSNK